MGPVAEVLIFEVAGQRHALPIAQVRELLPALSVTPLPTAPPGVAGVINLRGIIVPVLDVRHRFGLPAKAVAPSDHFIVACVQEQLIVLHVDRALELVEVEADALGPAEPIRSLGAMTGRVVKCAAGLVPLHETQDFLPREGGESLLQHLAPVQERRP